MVPTPIAIDSLEQVRGGTDSIPAFGRCGPADHVSFLGNVYTPECAAHDAAVRGELAKGSSQLRAQLKALPKLPAAVGSYFRERFR